MSTYKGFSKVKLTAPTKSTFDLTHDKRLTMRPGRLTPVYVQECVPSDFFSGSSEMLVRLAPLLAPIYDQVQIYVHYFFVPNRLLWADWEEFITGGRLGVGIDPVDAPIPPFINIGSVISLSGSIFQKRSLADFLGVPDLIAIGGSYTGLTLDIMPFAAYHLIYHNYYRDRNFETDALEELFPLASGGMAAANFQTQLSQLRIRKYSHDYFTSALPFTQRGEEVLIPLDGSVTYLQQSRIVDSTAGTLFTNNDLVLSTQDTPDFPPGSASVQNAPNIDGSSIRVENIDSISNISTTINDFRTAYALQVWLERNAIAGSRYVESNMAHFKVRSQDSRLQRPEYIGGGRIPVKISEVVSTAFSQNADDAVVPLANMAGHGVSYGNTNQFKYFCSEHGFIIGLASVMTPGSYHQGLPRMFRRRSFLDYPWPTFAKLGEQQVDAVEIYASPENLTEDENGVLPLFGYQSRYADWKYIANSNHGDFHDTMLFWTTTRDFADSPTLSVDFLQYDEETFLRMFAVTDFTADPIWVYCHNRITVKRPLPYFGTPNTLGFV